jgi:hypothetical protein
MTPDPSIANGNEPRRRPRYETAAREVSEQRSSLDLYHAPNRAKKTPCFHGLMGIVRCSHRLPAFAPQRGFGSASR